MMELIPLSHTCKICGVHEQNQWTCHKKLTERQLCFTCYFWTERIEDADWNENRFRVVVKGKHYIGYSPKVDTGMKGFGGQLWKIKFLDGREVECRNLWHQGEIPERFRSQLPDNAEFLRT